MRRPMSKMFLAFGLAGWLAFPAPGSPAQARRRDVPSVPALFAQYLSPPGKSAKIKFPGRLLFDPVGKETLLADIGNNRILFFDSNNVFRFQFFGNEQATSIQDVAVTGDGRVFILSAANDGWRIAKFDYDGRYLSSMAIPPIEGQPSPEWSSMAAGRDGNLFLLNDAACEIAVIDTAGKPIRHFGVTGKLDEKQRRDLIYGAISTHDSLLLVPMSSFGILSVYGQGGGHLRDIGSKGGGTGELNFPVAAAINRDGVLLVLDKNRFCVICFGPDGKLLGEFGGKGMREGWFYHPQRITVNARNQIVIGQNLNGAIQVCEPPAFLNPGGLPRPDSLDLQSLSVP